MHADFVSPLITDLLGIFIPFTVYPSDKTKSGLTSKLLHASRNTSLLQTPIPLESISFESREAI